MSKDFDIRRKFLRKEKKLGLIHYKIAIVLLVVFILQDIFLEHITIGNDERYFLYIIALPILLGLFVLSFYRRNFLRTKLGATKGFAIKTLAAFFYLVQGILFSYLSLGVAAKTTWNYCNKIIAEQNATEIIDCNIQSFEPQYGRWARNHIYFEYKGELQSLIVSDQTIKKYLDKKPSDYKLEIIAQRGLWNYYVVNMWTVKSWDNTNSNQQ